MATCNLDDVLEYLLNVDAKKMGVLKAEDLEKKFKVDYFTLVRELPESPQVYLERFKAFRTALELSQQKTYREMPVEKLSRALGFITPSNFQYIFRQYSGIPVETCRKHLNDLAKKIENENRSQDIEKKQQEKTTEIRLREKERRRQARKRRRQARERKKTTARVKNKRTAKG